MNRWAGAVVLGAAIAAGTALFACRQIIGIPSNQGGDSTTACGLPYGTNACAACANTNCCSESNACAGDPACAPFFQCLGACTMGDWQCRSQCLLDHPTGTSSAFAPLRVCTASHCESECELTCGGLDYVAPPKAAVACQACLSQNDCAEERACATSVDCVALGQCQRGCTTPDCRIACSLASEAGAAAIQDGGPTSAAWSASFFTVYGVENIDPMGQCAPACAYGANWTCVGNVVWPGRAGMTTMASKVLDYISPATPIPGAKVSLCSFLDSTCSMPLATGTTDPTGELVLPVPASAVGNGGGLQSDGYVQITSGSTIPDLYFYGYPVSKSLAPIAEPLALIFTVADVPLLNTSLGLDGGYDASEPGSIGFTVLDCDGYQAPGVRVALDGDAGYARAFYTSGANGLTLSTTATETGGNGIGGFAFVTSDRVTLTATPLALGKPSSRATVLVRPGTITNVFMFPTPSSQMNQ